jgi:hypothetical protein
VARGRYEGPPPKIRRRPPPVSPGAARARANLAEKLKRAEAAVAAGEGGARDWVRGPGGGWERRAVSAADLRRREEEGAAEEGLVLRVDLGGAGR